MSHKKPISLSLNSDCAISNLEPMEPAGFEPAHLKGLTASMLCDLALLSGIADENSQRDTSRTGKQSQKKASESEKRGEKPQVKKEQEEVAKSEEFEKSLDEDIARAMKEEEEGVFGIATGSSDDRKKRLKGVNKDTWDKFDHEERIESQVRINLKNRYCQCSMKDFEYSRRINCSIDGMILRAFIKRNSSKKKIVQN